MKHQGDLEKNQYLKLLRMARAEMNKPEGINEADFRSRLKEVGINQHWETLWERIYDSRPNIGLRNPHMGFDAFMHLLEYEELKHSLEESEKARKQANTATWIAIVAIVIQILQWLF